MAQGDVVFFDQWLVDVAEGIHDHENDQFQIGLTTGATTPSATTPDPHWGGTGTTNFASEQVSVAGAYTGPVTLANPAVALVGGSAEIDWDDPGTWSQNASSPSNATYGIIFNNTSTNKKAVGYVDLGGAFDMTTGDLTITFGTPAADLDQA